MFLMVSGRLFHNFGAAAENDLSPYTLVLAIGVCKRFFADDLNILLVRRMTVAILSNMERVPAVTYKSEL